MLPVRCESVSDNFLKFNEWEMIVRIGPHFPSGTKAAGTAGYAINASRSLTITVILPSTADRAASNLSLYNVPFLATGKWLNTCVGRRNYR